MTEIHPTASVSPRATIGVQVEIGRFVVTVDSLHPPCQQGREGPTIASGTIIGAKVLLLPRVRLGENAVVAGSSIVTHDVESNTVMADVQAKPIKRRDEVRCHIEGRPAHDLALELLSKIK